MPGFDGTGPAGEGAMTGYGRGFCIRELKPGDSLYSALQRRGRRCVPAGMARGYRWGQQRPAAQPDNFRDK